MANLALAFDILARDKGASRTFDKVGDAADRAAKHGEKFGTLMGAGIASAGIAIVAFAKKSVTAFKDSEQSSARLDDALRKFPKTADITRASLDKLNASLAKKTVFDDDATASGQAVLAQFGLTGKQIVQLTPLLQDYAAKTGRDIPTAAEALGKAVLGQGRALKDIGLNFKDAGSKSANFEQLVGGLRTQVGGFAEKEGKTAAGQAKILGNQYGELQETVGSKLVPVLTKLAEKLLQVIDFVSRNQKVIVPLAIALGTIGGTLWVVVKATQAFTAAQAALDVVLAANPIGLVVIAVAALAAGLVLLWKKSETFRTIVTGVFKAVGGVVLTMVDLWLGAFQALASGLSHLPFIGDKFKGVAEGIGKVRDKIHQMKDDLANLGQNVTRIPVVIDVRTATGKGVATAIANKLDMDTRASGGPVRRGHPYLVGENGPELIVPAHSGRVVDALKTRRFSAEAAHILAGWTKGDRLADMQGRTYRSLDVNPNARLDTSQIIDARFGESQRGGLHVHGGIHVVAHRAEDAALAIPRGLRNLSHRLGF